MQTPNLEESMKSLMWLTGEILANAGMICCTDTRRDLLTISRRVEDEGESFLTITLPAYAEAFEKALSDGQLSPNTFLGFKKAGGSIGLPALLRGFLELIFDRTGSLYDRPSVEAIRCVRQVCRLHKKVLLPCTPSRRAGALTAYKQVEAELEEADDCVSHDDLLSHLGGVLYAGVAAAVNREIDSADLRPKHGPGKTTDRLSGNGKWSVTTWYERFQTLFPMDRFMYLNLNHALSEEGLDRTTILSEAQEPPVKVVLVPKTMKTPRVIALESTAMQFMQQALMRVLVSTLESDAITAGHLNFSDQSKNREMARLGSISGSYATIDLSEASDRVSLRSVQVLFRKHPVLRDALEVLRSRTAVLPDGSLLTLRKYASMGSALCFPVESMLFFALSIMALLGHTTRPTTREIKRVSREVYVYGDDLIIPTHAVPRLTSLLSSYGLRVNHKKTFWTGKFRESCGADWYDGEDVSTVFLRYAGPVNRRDATSIVSLISFANQLYRTGWWSACRAVRLLIEQSLDVPHVSDTSSSLGWTSVQSRSTIQRWSTTLHRFEHLGIVVSPKKNADELEGYSALHKCLSSTSQEREEWSRQHLTQSVRSGSASIRRRWVPS